jgi:ATP-binding cassette, subfamily B, bacterial MsbA
METFKRLLAYSKPYWWRILISAVASLGLGGVDGALAYMVGPFLQKLFVSKEPTVLYQVAGAVVGLAIFKGTFRVINEYFIRTAGQLAVQDVRNDVYRTNMHLGLRFFNANPTGALMSRVLSDVNAMQEAIAYVITGLFRDGFSAIALLGVIFYRDWRLALISFLVLPAAAVPANIIGKRIKRISRQSQEKMGDLAAILQETFSGIKVIKAFGLENREVEKFRRANWEYYRFMRRAIRYDIASSPSMEVITSLGIAGVVLIGGHMVIIGKMTAPNFLSYITAMALLYQPIKRLLSSYNIVQRSMGAAARVFEVVDEKREIVDAPDAKPLGVINGEVEFRDVWFRYNDDYVLKGISLKANRGEIVALVGPSGGGKTTLVSLILRFYDITKGSLLVEGADIRTVTIRSLLDHVALVDQETILFNDTIANNIRYGKSDASDAEVEAAARAAFAHDFIVAMPEGYESRIGDRGVRLSGGQRQRICIARAILKNAPILILDEATSALDTESEQMVQDAINNLMANRTTFVIAHRLSTILHADKIVVVEGGEIVETGTHPELLENGGTYRKLYDMQFRA